jgi:predicted permease
MSGGPLETLIAGFLKDARYALRQLHQKPGFTVVAVLVLALGLGANASIFSVVNAVLLKPLPYNNPQTLVTIFERDVVGLSDENHYNSISAGLFSEWQRNVRSLAFISAVRRVAFNVSTRSQTFTPQRVNGVACSDSFFRLLDVTPLLGRFFAKSEDALNAPYVAVISYGFWQDHFASDRKVVGQSLRLDGNSYTVIGVLPRRFVFPGEPADVFVSFNRILEENNRNSFDNHFFSAIGRLAPGYSVAQARDELNAITRNVRREHPKAFIGQGVTLTLLHEYLVRNLRGSLLMLLGAVGCLLLITCVNIANLLLTRALGRQRELSIRCAVGAGRGQIIRQLLIESSIISLLGAGAGLIVAGWTSSFLAARAPGADRLPQVANIRIDPTVLLFTFGIALLCGLAAGLFPALVTSRTDVLNGLKDTSRSSTAGRTHSLFRNTLVSLEVATSLVLLIGAGLLLRSFYNVQRVQFGFQSENSISFALSLPEATYKQRANVSNFLRTLVGELRAIPGVVSAGLISHPPLSGHWSDSVYHIQGHPLPPGTMMDLVYRSADPGYFKALGIPLIRGRFLSGRDGIGFDDYHPQLGEALISKAAAEKFFPTLDPLGKILGPGPDSGVAPAPSGKPFPSYQIVGVVGDVPTNVETGIEPTFYGSLFDGDNRDFYGIVRSHTDPAKLIGEIQNQIRRLDPDIPLHEVRTFSQINSSVTENRRFSVSLLALFAAVAVLLAAVGLYGVVSYAVTQRTAEIGIRMALGAGRSEVSRMIVLDGMKPALLGVAAGLLASLGLSRLLANMLFGVSSSDLLTFGIVSGLLTLVVIAACLIPALRATRIDPTIALRTE